MTQYMTTDVELASVADAIREKGGTSAQLVYPAGFVSAVDEITTNTPEEVSTDEGMTAKLTAGNIGKAYIYTGTTGTYTNGDIYIVEDV